jgi:hypothetical protein
MLCCPALSSFKASRRLPGGERRSSSEVAASKTFASLVLDYSLDGDLRDDVLSGDKGLQAAAEIARERKRAKAEKQAKKERLKEAAPDLYALVADDDKADVDEAIAALDVREAKARRGARGMTAAARAQSYDDPGTGLVRYDAMCRAIDAAYEVDEVKAIHDTAAMLQAADARGPQH